MSERQIIALRLFAGMFVGLVVLAFSLWGQMYLVRESVGSIESEATRWREEQMLWVGTMTARDSLEAQLALALRLPPDVFPVTMIDFRHDDAFIWIERPLRDDQVSADTVLMLVATLERLRPGQYRIVDVIMRGESRAVRMTWMRAGTGGQAERIDIEQVAWETAVATVAPTATPATGGE